MKRNNYSFKQLMEQNKEELQRNLREIEKIEKKLDSKLMNVKQ
ncbi:FbpB family small basic protein [Niallia sp. Krafla_26]